MTNANPHDALALLRQLHETRKRTREIARTQLAPDAVRPFIDTFQGIEDMVLDEIETNLKTWILETETELTRLRAKLDEVDKKDLNLLCGDEKCDHFSTPLEPVE